MEHIKYYLPGTLLIVAAIVIMAFPEILVALIAVSIVLAGVGAISIGHMMRKAEREYEHFHPSDHTFFTRPLFKGWYARF